jgi:hypothetical protein
MDEMKESSSLIQIESRFLNLHYQPSDDFNSWRCFPSETPEPKRIQNQEILWVIYTKQKEVAIDLKYLRKCGQGGSP